MTILGARLAIVAVLILTLLRPSPLAANTFGAVTCNTDLSSQCVSNNGAHYYRYISLTSGMESAATWVFTNTYDPITDVVANETTDVDLTDVWLTDGSYGTNGYRAWVKCAETATYGGSGVGRWCKAQGVWLNNGEYPGEYDTYAERRFVACHEVGHSLGLHHSSDVASCMKDLPLNYSGTYEYNLTTHDETHLTDWY